ncbi:hypothetical protein FEP70_05527 [Burkholderia multivorans]|nr:hypothetical protein [Burkholderia multivorans]MDR8914860.1 hypothetical protein [Burkholderia multivorans]MDR8939304.1 hypothetical protein [Burkholderia multivorans]MDR8981498.1 hypothetical protein [Burkholderia multivorans]MDR8987577.1 hypothetical protein [Burkholderia multivorans]
MHHPDLRHKGTDAHPRLLAKVPRIGRARHRDGVAERLDRPRLRRRLQHGQNRRAEPRVGRDCEPARRHPRIAPVRAQRIRKQRLPERIHDRPRTRLRARCLAAQRIRQPLQRRRRREPVAQTHVQHARQRTHQQFASAACVDEAAAEQIHARAIPIGCTQIRLDRQHRAVVAVRLAQRRGGARPDRDRVEQIVRVAARQQHEVAFGQLQRTAAGGTQPATARQHQVKGRLAGRQRCVRHRERAVEQTAQIELDVAAAEQ